MRNKLIITLVVLFNINNSVIGQDFDYIIYDNFNCFYLGKDKKEERFRIVNYDDSVYKYRIGFYNNDDKVGAWFTLDSKLKLVSECFYYNSDTLYEIDINKNILKYKDSLNIFQGRNFSVSEWLFYYDNNNKNPLSKIGKNKYYFRMFPFGSLYFTLDDSSLKKVYFLNNKNHLDRKMFVFDGGEIVQEFTFSDGLLDGEVLFYKNSNVVTRLIYSHGILLYPKRLKNLQLKGFFYKKTFFPNYSKSLISGSIYCGYFGVISDEKSVPTYFDISKKNVRFVEY